MKKKYKVLKNGEIIKSNMPGKYAGWKPGKIFGRLDCKFGIFAEYTDMVYSALS